MPFQIQRGTPKMFYYIGLPPPHFQISYYYSVVYYSQSVLGPLMVCNQGYAFACACTNVANSTSNYTLIIGSYSTARKP